LAGLDAKVKQMGAKRIAFDALDVVLVLLEDPRAVRREVYRLHKWLRDRELTGILTYKSGRDDQTAMPLRFDFMQFMVDCSIVLDHTVVEAVSQRTMRVVKYRGSAFDGNEAPVVFGSRGIEVAYAPSHSVSEFPATTERISSGVERLDTMLGGGYFRGAGILLTGSPGTAKTTLSGAFVEAACQRGESSLIISFDSAEGELVRNLSSVGIHLAPYCEQGLLRVHSARSIQGSAEIHLMRIREMAEAGNCRCLVVDPISALSKAGNIKKAHSVVERLIAWAKQQGITIMTTSLLDEEFPELEGTPLEISTIADTWIHLNYLVLSGERNRGLSIVKSRGTAHSNQVRELILDEKGVTLADVYTAGGEVLMGSMRFQKEQEERLARHAAQQEIERRRTAIEADTAGLELQLHALQRALAQKRAERAALDDDRATDQSDFAESQESLHMRRAGDDQSGSE